MNRVNKILILGASGNFGSKIAKALAKKNNALILAGRKTECLLALQKDLLAAYPHASIDVAVFDIAQTLDQQLKQLRPYVVINTCGPFQGADYSVALNCVRLGIHYIDLADGREFVNGIHQALDKEAREKGCLVVSGASTVPCLSSAVIEYFKDEFSEIDSLDFGIAPGQKSDRGLATTQAILSYVGKPLKPIWGSEQVSYGWQNPHRQRYPELGLRWLANCDIPDLDLLPQQYGIKHIRFAAGIENSLVHLGLWALSWAIRLGLPIHLERYAPSLLKLSHAFDRFGSNDGGMHVIIKGKDYEGKDLTIKWFIIGKEGDGPYIPTVPAIVLAQKLVEHRLDKIGAMPCIGLITLEEYLSELNDFNIQTCTQ